MSHTTDDMIFEWLPEKDVPLAVDEGIQLPQLELINNSTGDCTSVYSTGKLQSTYYNTVVGQDLG